MGKTRKPNNQHNPRLNYHAHASGLASDRQFVARLRSGAQRVSELAMRLRAMPLATLAVPVALTLLVAVATGTVHPHPYPGCPGVTPCTPVSA